jgi:hypothetical protein
MIYISFIVGAFFAIIRVQFSLLSKVFLVRWEKVVI